MGPRTHEFEAAWAAYCGVRHAVLMAQRHGRPGGGPAGARHRTGRRGHHRLLHVQRDGQRHPPGRARARCSSTSARTTSAWIPRCVEAAITPRTRAIMPVHLYGLMADMDPLVDDRRPSRPRDHRGRGPGPRRHVRRATGRPVRAGDVQPVRDEEPDDRRRRLRDDDDDELADRLRLYRNHGMRVRYQHESLGTNFKPTDLAAAIGLAQLARLDERTEQRRRNAAPPHARGCGGYLTPTRPGRSRARLAPVHDAVPGRARRRVVDGLAERGDRDA